MNKSSYIQWLGNIPDDWEVVKIGNIFSEVTEKNHNLDFLNAFKFNYGNIVEKKNIDLDNQLKDTYSKYLKVSENDIVINGLNLNYDFISERVAIVKQQGIITSAYIVIRPNSNINPKFYCYLLKCLDNKKVFHGMGTGIRLTLSFKELKYMSLPLPPLSVQRRISSYLDEKTELINRLIETRTAQIEKLKQYRAAVVSSAVTKGLNPNRKMKNSNIQWIGEIPEDWEVVKLGKVLILNPGKKNIDDNIPVSFMPMECLRNGIIKRKIALYKDVEKYTPFMENDVVMAKVTPCFENGNIAIAKDLENGLGFGTSEIYVFRCSNHIKNSYLFYLLQSNYIIRIGVASMSGTGGLKRVKSEVLKNAAIPLPSLSEQREIVSYLDKKVSEINNLIKTYEDEIEKMKSYKNSLVSAVVTGQIAV